jgi:glycosyltransferase involved in cell wall biosynthesis
VSGAPAPAGSLAGVRAALFGNTDWYLYNFRLSLIRRLHDEGATLVLLSPDGPYGEKLKAMGFDWRPLPMERRSLNPFAEARLVGHLAGLLRREKIDIVHGFTIKPALYAGLAGRLAGVKGRIGAVAGLGFVFISDSLKARALRPVVRAMAWLAFGGPRARLIVQNPDDRAAFVDHRLVDPGRVRTIPGSGVDLSRFAVSSRRRASGEPLKVLLAARMLWDKGLAEFVEAARALKAEGRQIRFLLAGEPDPGNPAACAPADLAGWTAEGLVEHLGHVDDMPALLGEVDVVVLPSYREGLPKTLIEAAGCALPLITTDVPGCREVVCHEEDGLLVPARDWRGLAQAMARLDDDEALRRRLGLAARDKALRLFDEQIVLARTLDVYRELSCSPEGGGTGRATPPG